MQRTTTDRVRFRLVWVCLCAWWVVGLAGCASSGTRQEMALMDRLLRLRSGMTYVQVGDLLGPVDPGLRDDIRGILREEREARQDLEVSLRSVPVKGLKAPDVIPSQFTIHRGDYVLSFENGRLTAWR